MLPRLDDESLARVTDAPLGALVLTLTYCGACQHYEREITTLAAAVPTALAGTRLGKLVLDLPGAHRFKRHNQWLPVVRAGPCTILYTNGRIAEAFTRADVAELAARLERLRGTT